jgi:hypothetical protein
VIDGWRPSLGNPVWFVSPDSIGKLQFNVPELQAFANNLWIIDGPNVRDLGVKFTTRMAVVKLSNGLVWVSSPVSVDFATLTRMTVMGTVKYLIAGTQRHVWRLEAWHRLFPDAELWAPRTTPITLKKGPLPFTGVLGDTPSHGWSADFDQLAFKGSPLIEEIIFLHKESRTVILDDLIQNHPIANGKPLRNALLKLSGAAYPNGGVPLDIRLTFTRRHLAQQSLQKLLAWEFDKLIIAHGVCIKTQAKSFVERAFRWLVR